MSTLDRRQLLAGFLNGLVGAAGTVVLARSVLPAAASQEGTATPPSEPQPSLQERADQVAADQGPPAEEATEPCSFVNGAFRNGGGFRNGGFTNGGFRNGGSFRNGGFANGGGFRNGGFANGGGFRNGGFGNGGFRKGGFLN